MNKLLGTKCIYQFFFIVVVMFLNTLCRAGQWYSLGPEGGIVNALAEDSGGTLFAATPSGVRKSRDGGVEWSVLNAGLGLSLNVQQIVVTGDDRVIAFATGALFRLASGDVWSDFSEGIPPEELPTLVFLAVDRRDVLYAATIESVFFRPRAGAAWQRLPGNGLPSILLTVGITSDKGGNVYVASQRVLVPPSVYKLAPGASAWTEVVAGLTRAVPFNIAGLQSDSAGNQYLATTAGIYKLNADVWQPYNEGYTGGVQLIAVSHKDTIYAANGTDVYERRSGSPSWTNLGGHATEARMKFLHSRPDESLVLSLQRSDLVRSDNALFSRQSGDTWRRLITNGLFADAISAVAPDVSGNIHVGRRGVDTLSAITGKWTSSPDFGRTDSAMVSAMVTDGYNNVYAAVAPSSTVTQAEVYFIPNGADRWYVLGPGLPSAASPSALAFDHNGVLYLGLDGSGVYYFDVFAERWLPRNQGLTEYERPHVVAIAADGNNNLLAHLDGEGVHRLRDGADAWELYNVGLPEERVNLFAFDSGGNTFVGTQGQGVYKLGSDDYWSPDYACGAARFITGLAVDPTSDDLYIGTLYGRFYKQTGTRCTELETSGLIDPRFTSLFFDPHTGFLFGTSRFGGLHVYFED